VTLLALRVDALLYPTISRLRRPTCFSFASRPSPPASWGAFFVFFDFELTLRPALCTMKCVHHVLPVIRYTSHCLDVRKAFIQICPISLMLTNSRLTNISVDRVQKQRLKAHLALVRSIGHSTFIHSAAKMIAARWGTRYRGEDPHMEFYLGALFTVCIAMSYVLSRVRCANPHAGREEPAAVLNGKGRWWTSTGLLRLQSSLS
jgi:hypothetical protein